MLFDELLRDLEVVERGGSNPPVNDVVYDSRRVIPGAVFVAMSGGTTDGNRYIESALQQGAVALVTDSDLAWQRMRAAHPELAIARVEHGRRALAGLSANFFGHPEKKLKLSGVTGTNGKTTTSWLLESMLRSVGRSCVLAGTIEYHVGGEIRPSPHTTPESRDLYQLLSEGVEAGASEAVAEVSSHALDQGRVWGLHWDTAVFTNLTQDHLDYHGNMESYFQAKTKLFTGQGAAPPRVAIIHAGDDYGRRMMAQAEASGCDVITYDLDSGDFHAEHIQVAEHGMRFRIISPGGEMDVHSHLIGPVNVLNLLAASAAATARGLTPDEIAGGIEAIDYVPGRFQTVDCGQPFTVVVDYAHTDDALRNVTRLAHALAAPRNGRVITVFGCGGDRDRAKRPKMGRAVGEGSDFVVVTSDNPRSEDPAAILAEILPGVAASGVSYSDRSRPRSCDSTGDCRGGRERCGGDRRQRARKSADSRRPHDSFRRCRSSAEGAAGEILRSPRRKLGRDRMQLTLEQIRYWMNAQSLATHASTSTVSGYSIDSRTIQPGDLFFAVRGERFDGHDFVESALKAGAVAAVISAAQRERYTDVAMRLLLVDDPLSAMQRLASSVRRHWGKRVIGITGSAGKTTTKEAVAQVLESRFRVHRSEGNLNNHFGLPLQLLKLQPEHDIAILEMGMSHAGEIAALCRIAAPDWGVVTNVGLAHAENFADGQAGIARAKYELIAALPRHGTSILNCDDAYARLFGRDFAGNVIYFGTGACADPRAESIVSRGAEGTRFTVLAGEERAQVELRLLGEHNVRNALAGIAAGVASGIPLDVCAAALRKMEPPEKRGQTLQIRGATLLNDCYNSNPDALRAMVDTLLTLPARRRIVVAGEMLELGPDSPQLHRECGEYMGNRGIDIVVGVRGEAASIVAGAAQTGWLATFVATPEDAGAWLREHLQPGDAVLLKASRGVRLERALDELRRES